MLKLKYRMVMGACALLTVGSIGQSANAAVTNVYGGGSSLVAPYARQSMDCYGNPTALIFKGTPPVLQDIPPFNYTGSPPFDCSTQHVNTNATLNYISTGSGTGINGVYSNDPSLYGDTDPNQGGNQFYPSVQYGLSDTGLDSTDVGIYNNGGTGNHIGVTVAAPGQTCNPPSLYCNPRQYYGPLVQFPVSVDPVAFTYERVYKKVRNADGSVTSYKFNVQFTRGDNSGGLRLDADTYCKIFNGQITDWKDLPKSLNKNKSLEDPQDPTPSGSWSVPLQIVGRSDSSGTTSIFTRHLANVCASLSGNQYADGATTLPSSLQGPTYDKAQPNQPPVSGETLGKFTRAAGSDGIAKYVAFTADPGTNDGDFLVQGRMGYVGTDYVLPYVNNTGTNTYGLNSASLKNAQSQFVAPTPASAAVAYSVIQPPQSDARGNYDPNNTAFGLRSNPQDWVQPPSKTSPLANPTATGSYPVVGSTNFLGYSCYSTPAKKGVISGWVSWFLTSTVTKDKTLGILAKAGLASLPGAFQLSENNTFVKNKDLLGLQFNTVGSGVCTGDVTGG